MEFPFEESSKTYKKQIEVLAWLAEFFPHLGIDKFWLGGGFALDFLIGKPLRDHDDIDLVMESGDAKLVRQWAEKNKLPIEEVVPGAMYSFGYKGVSIEIEYGDLRSDGALVWNTKVAPIGYTEWQLEGKLVQIPGINGSIQTLSPEAIYLIKEYIGREKDHKDMELLGPLINHKKIETIRKYGVQWCYTKEQFEKIKQEQSGKI